MRLLQIANRGMLEYRVFSLNEWRFKNENLRQVYKNLSSEDQAVFNFDVWNVSLGFKVYVFSG